MAKAPKEIKVPRTPVKKKTRQGKGTFTKWATHKNSKLYKKKYRGQGR